METQNTKGYLKYTHNSENANPLWGLLVELSAGNFYFLTFSLIFGKLCNVLSSFAPLDAHFSLDRKAIKKNTSSGPFRETEHYKTHRERAFLCVLRSQKNFQEAQGMPVCRIDGIAISATSRPTVRA